METLEFHSILLLRQFSLVEVTKFGKKFFEINKSIIGFVERFLNQRRQKLLKNLLKASTRRS